MVEIKRRVLPILMIFVLIIVSTSVAFANEVQNFPDENDFLIIPVFDSIEEAECAMENGNGIALQNASDIIGDAGGTQYCYIYAFIVRSNSLMQKCELYFRWESDFRINAIRFSELVVEKAPVPLAGKNYLKLKPESGKSYCTYDVGSTYSGQKTICSDFNIPLDEDKVIVRSKGIGVFLNSSSSWIACQYQLGGVWSVTPGNAG